MTQDIGNTLLKHCGEPDMPEIPGAALQSIINDTLKPDCDDRYALLQRQVEALEEHNQSLATERDFYKQRAHEMEERAMEKINRLRSIEAAARNLAKVKGRHNSEIAMDRLLEALK